MIDVSTTQSVDFHVNRLCNSDFLKFSLACQVVSELTACHNVPSCRMWLIRSAVQAQLERSLESMHQAFLLSAVTEHERNMGRDGWEQCEE